MARAALRGAPVFPKGPRQGRRYQERESGETKPNAGFKIPKHLLRYVSEQTAKGVSKTQVFVRGLEISADATGTLGDEWWEVERRAAVEGVSAGTMLGRLALIGLEKKRK